MKTKIETPKWMRDEFTHVGADFSDAAEVEKYAAAIPNDTAMFDELIEQLGLKPSQTLLDFGAGPCAFAIHAAKCCNKVYAVDVSPAMLEYARNQAAQAGIENMEFHHGGFLTYEHSGPALDAIVSHKVLHHLPDMWKLIALRRMAKMLKIGGRFHLQDVVFSFVPENYEEEINGMIEFVREKVSEEVSVRMNGHIAKEYSTMDWIMEGLLRQAGFRLDKVIYPGVLAEYFCTRIT